MLEEIDLAVLIDKIIEARKIPLRRPDRCWGGTGTGGDCAICGERLKPTEAECELEYHAMPGSVASAHHVHIPCLTAWELRVHRSTAGPVTLTRLEGGQQADTNNDTQRLPLTDEERRMLGGEASRPRETSP